MRRLPARWMPRWLTPEKKLIRMTTSEECLALVIITHQRPKSSPYNRQQRMNHQETVPLVGKVMARAFWDAKGIIPIEYLRKGRINKLGI